MWYPGVRDSSWVIRVNSEKRPELGCQRKVDLSSKSQRVSPLFLPNKLLLSYRRVLKFLLLTLSLDIDLEEGESIARVRVFLQALVSA
ncbi:hypothetical protein E2542_SST08574 [Spatholobus suberectus]|nr:hypothetical protein E2542_SST08574 [Spatholobus suberectus]